MALSFQSQNSLSKPLRLAAFDGEDLAVISAQTQDALACVGDLAYRPSARKFIIALSRFDWLAAQNHHKIRRASVLRFDCVRGVRHCGLAHKPTDFVINLLAVRFIANNPPSGQVRLDFSQNIAIALDVECLEAALHDLNATRPARFRPRHFGQGLS